MKNLIEQLCKEQQVREDLRGVAASAALAGALLLNPMHADAAKPVSAQHQEVQSPHKKLYDVVWAESNHGKEEVQAVASVYLNLIKMKGASIAYNKSVAHKGTSKEYKKARDSKLSAYEHNVYNQQKQWIDELISDPSKILPYDHHENVKRYGNPYWAHTMVSHKDIGGQRFYASKELVRFLKLGK